MQNCCLERSNILVVRNEVGKCSPVCWQLTSLELFILFIYYEIRTQGTI